MTVKPIEIGVFKTIPTGFEERLKELEIGERIVTISNISLLRLVRIESFGDLRRLAIIQSSVKRPTAKAEVEAHNE